MAGQPGVDVTDKLPKRISPSRLSNFIQCPGKFYFGSILRLASPATHATTKGTLAHEAFELIFDLPREERTPDNAVIYVRPAWAKLRDDPKYVHLAALGSEYEETLIADAQEAVRGWFHMENPKRFDAGGRETRMEVDVAGVPLIGILDRIDEVTYPSGAVRTLISDYKGLALDTVLPTPTGWTTMGEVAVGELLIGADGLPTTVTVKSEVHNRPCYELGFDDGCKIVCDNTHLWQVEFRSHKTNVFKTLVVDTDKLAELHGEGYVRVLNAQPIDLAVSALPLDPYLLGVWLGDGASRGGLICVGEQDREEMCILLSAVGERAVTTVEGVELPKPFPSECMYGHTSEHRVSATATTCRDCERAWKSDERINERVPVNSTLALRLKRMGLQHNKHVPTEYLRASTEQRLSLIQGLMDTDGSWNDGRSQAVFTNTNLRLVEAAEELISSMGWTYSRFERPYSKSDGTPKMSYQVMFTPYGLNPFRLSRKFDAAARVVDRGDEIGVKSRSRLIETVMPVTSVPTQCVAVDNADKLYLAGPQMIPTHNTGRAPDPTSKYYEEKFFGMKVYAVMHHAITGVVPYQLRLIFVIAADRSGVMPIDCDEHLIKNVTTQLKTIWAAIKRNAKRGTFECKTQPLCNWCEFQPLCPAHNPEIAHLPLDLTEMHNANLADMQAKNLSAAGVSVTPVTLTAPADAGTKDDDLEPATA